MTVLGVDRLALGHEDHLAIELETDIAPRFEVHLNAALRGVPPRAMADRLDTHAERLRAEMPGPTWSRSDVVRSLLAKALDAADGAAPKGRRGK